ncbi:zinc-binding dehydrogenase [Mycobacterium sp. ACS4331]|uniref:zinc-binding dehydrogenase n=1 Tax=Mycobacterium sp. ACS4331 TaxID=1834121 RepID=UPI0007FBDB73|nr:zinc-binding dehydrogenase [Mycobacterium sp. ACS4331]OBF30118.1 alcohol dehydrogenase [Mycobacterium sp. ACS4331]
MKAVSCQHATLSVVDVPSPQPARGQLLLTVLRCGICGSDLHAKDHADELAEVMTAVGVEHAIASDVPVVFGHEFCGEVAERGRGTGRQFRTGARVVSFPLLRARGGVHLTGLSPAAPGGYAEQVLAEAALSFVVPNGLSPDIAALTEPMAVALHAVRRSDITRRDTAVVIGCGPVGLAIICHLKAQGVENIIASDPSPGRRELARRCGATLAVDPTEESPYASAPGVTSGTELYELGMSAMEKMRRVPGWVHLYRIADKLGAGAPKRPVIFECVGNPGMIDSILAAAPFNSRVVVAGVCMGADRLRPTLANSKEIDLRFVFAYTPLEFRDTLHLLADGRVDAAPMVTDTVGLQDVAAAFEALGNPDKQAKVLIDPSLR